MLHLARSLAMVFLSGPFEPQSMSRRGQQLFGKRHRWITLLAERICRSFPSAAPPQRSVLAKFIARDGALYRALERYDGLGVANWKIPRGMTCPLGAEVVWKVPSLSSPGELADWLRLTAGELEWFADRYNREYRQGSLPRLGHYHCRALPKRSGRIRMIEAPKPRLRELQRRIYSRLLSGIPVHPCVHGFVPGRSIKTFAAEHVGRRVILRLDLEDFFPSISKGRVQALFRAVGYPERVADLLAGMCTYRTPDEAWDNIDGPNDATLPNRWMYAAAHLPQGAPTSPAIANLCAYRMDCRLAALAQAASAKYTRYADDLAFSGDREFERGVRRFHLLASVIAMEEGFKVNFRKTRISRAGSRQRLAGVVVNQRLNVPREDYDRLKAILTNCVRKGPASQNREDHPDFQAHLLGRISFVAMIHSDRGQRLKEIFRQIDWSAPAPPGK